MQSMDLVLFEKCLCCTLQEKKALQQQLNIKLPRQFLTACLQLLHIFPFLTEATHLTDSVENEDSVRKQAERREVIAYVLSVPANSFSKLQLVSHTRETCNNEHKSKDSADQSSDVGKESIQLIKRSGIAGRSRRFHEKEGGISIVGHFECYILEYFRNNNPFIDHILSKREQTHICFNCKVLDLTIAIRPQLPSKPHIVLVLQVIAQIILISRIEQGIDQQQSYNKLFERLLIKIQCAVTDAGPGGIFAIIALLDSNLQKLHICRKVLSFKTEAKPQRRTQPILIVRGHRELLYLRSKAEVLGCASNQIRKFWSVFVDSVDEVALHDADIEEAEVVVEVDAHHLDCEHEGICGRVDGDYGFAWVELQLGSGGPVDDLHVDCLDGRAHEEGHKDYNNDQRTNASRCGLVLSFLLEAQKLRIGEKIELLQKFSQGFQD